MQDKKVTFGDVLVIGFAMFAMFFGAGNLIFPPFLGRMSGDQWIGGFVCFILADAGLAMMTVLAMIRKDGTIWSMTDRLGKIPSKLLAILSIATVGPILCIPRTCATTFEMGIQPLFPECSSWLFAAIFFGVTYALTIRPSAVVDIIGKFLTPALLLTLAVLVIVGIINPIGEISDVATVDSVAREGILAGYQTMDVLGALAVTLIVVGNAAQKGYEGHKSRFDVIAKSSIVAVIGLFVVYCGLAYLGATTSLIDAAAGLNQTALVVFITKSILGNFGVVLLALIVLFACLTTSIGLVSASADFFAEVTDNRIKYGTLVLLMCLFGFVISNVGISVMIAFATPLLNLVYPVLLTQIVLSFFEKQIGNDNVCRGAAIATLIVCAIGVLADYGVAGCRIVYKLPLSQFGFFWLLPAIIGGGIGAMIKSKEVVK